MFGDMEDDIEVEVRMERNDKRQPTGDISTILTL